MLPRLNRNDEEALAGADSLLGEILRCAQNDGEEQKAERDAAMIETTATIDLT